MRKREIKFRGWDYKRKEMVQLTTFDFGDGHEGSAIENFEDGMDGFEVMQYVGFKDKNGKEIYENDILRDEGIHGKVILQDVGKFYKLMFGPERYKYDEFEVIGNVFENPDLV